MARDKKDRKRKGKGAPLTKPLIATSVVAIVGLVGMYYFKTGAFPFEAGNLVEFLKLQWLW